MRKSVPKLGELHPGFKRWALETIPGLRMTRASRIVPGKGRGRGTHAPRTAPKPGPEAGLSLIEVTIAMGVMAIAALALSSTAVSGYGTIRASASQMQIENAVRETLESMTAQPFRKLDLLDGQIIGLPDEKDRFFLVVRVSSISLTLKAVDVEVFEKKPGEPPGPGGRKRFHAMTDVSAK